VTKARPGDPGPDDGSKPGPVRDTMNDNETHTTIKTGTFAEGEATTPEKDAEDASRPTRRRWLDMRRCARRLGWFRSSNPRFSWTATTPWLGVRR
jgi:hypothetical protein